MKTKDSLAPHQIRVVEEYTELRDRFDKLDAFADDPAFEGLDIHEQRLLTRQSCYMALYIQVLEERIEAF